LYGKLKPNIPFEYFTTSRFGNLENHFFEYSFTSLCKKNNVTPALSLVLNYKQITDDFLFNLKQDIEYFITTLHFEKFNLILNTSDADYNKIEKQKIIAKLNTFINYFQELSFTFLIDNKLDLKNEISTNFIYFDTNKLSFDINDKITPTLVVPAAQNTNGNILAKLKSITNLSLSENDLVNFKPIDYVWNVFSDYTIDDNFIKHNYTDKLVNISCDSTYEYVTNDKTATYSKIAAPITFSINPSPSNGSFIINSNKNIFLDHIEIINTKGFIIKKFQSNTNQLITLHNLIPGMYFIKISYNNKIELLKLIIN